ncbi:MAG: UDP-N-acetylglucosamine 1-carboxyvinyltransferase [Acutalibacteraceae bacterium]|nr:UDP-N-acetylglucosamine 1-carboxyvinyltransferase [Clostridia bacterium]MBQ1313634.1 UDP-N-acetylglucosamine 1-carboxyvinyltransferase [Clostridia bacterium]MEE1293125.1 UDP-N-acetylglucosamine 1-carboxyvinyltransferase [Acutalibacteraceae bacterium]MEE3374265.1 UDP-N-acetylglucosamine 1-carboxyvinyltransferase [Acutalibacteraceae bacterium]NLD29590.1 UDP-N-acetylglucosamine 1-carboxyvinyltransferase [Clostridiales bacterium]
MDKFCINGGKRLEGVVDISGAKNSVVAILPATLLAEGPCRIENIPNISDVKCMLEMLEAMGARIRAINPHTYEIDTSIISSYTVPYELTRHLRASYYLLGALLGRCSKARVAMPGGCDFGGVRPIDQHLKGFEMLGATVSMEENAFVHARADHLTGNSIYMDVVSVGATMNVMLAAVKARGLTVIENAAKEPHIVDLANFLNSMGADVRGAGTDVIKIRGVDHMHGCDYSVIPDQIEAGTYMAAVAACGGDVLVRNVVPKHLESIIAKLVEAGVRVEEHDDAVRVIADKPLTKVNIKTMPHPGFPTDMQPQMAAALCLANGTSIVSEGVWDSRFKYVDQLTRMGAHIEVNGKVAIIQGVDHLNGCPVKAYDLRAGAAMIIAGLAAKGHTEIENIIFIDRGYENVVEKFSALGADISREPILDHPDKIQNAG